VGGASGQRGGASESGGQLDDYFNIDDILVTEERIPCTFTCPVLNMGRICSHSGVEHIDSGTKVPLPCWLARALHSGNKRQRVITMDLPRQYNDVCRDVLFAEATCVNLQKLGSNYFSLAMRLISHFEHIESRDLAKTVLKAFQSRLRPIMDDCQNSLDADWTARTQSLDESELSIFERGSVGLREYLRWERRETSRLGPCLTVTNMRQMRKRKFGQISNDENE